MINGENVMSVLDINKFEGPIGSAFHGILVATGGTETAVATERNKFKFATVRTTIHGATKSRITAIEYFIYVFNNRFTWM